MNHALNEKLGEIKLALIEFSNAEIDRDPYLSGLLHAFRDIADTAYIALAAAKQGKVRPNPYNERVMKGALGKIRDFMPKVKADSTEKKQADQLRSNAAELSQMIERKSKAKDIVKLAGEVVRAADKLAKWIYPRNAGHF